uniref:Uncharacterized protein DDB_G0274171-like n=1 Tax=Diabrotica virgifera virgifera TaxID=50390 RepID=A0A6P7FL87_DIAVI
MKFLVLFALVFYCSSEVLANNGKPQCEGIQCDIPNCPPGDTLKYPGDEDTACCPYCERNPKCVGIQCDVPKCAPGSVVKLKENACCPSCEPFGNPRCAGIQCGVPLCPAGTVLRLVSGDCCPSCQPAR